jgi:hypothetical protein
MNHKLENLKSLRSMMSSRMKEKASSYKKPVVSISIERHDSPAMEDVHEQEHESNMLHEKMDAPIGGHSEESELSTPGDDVEGRRAMMRRFGK